MSNGLKDPRNAQGLNKFMDPIPIDPLGAGQEVTQIVDRGESLANSSGVVTGEIPMTALVQEAKPPEKVKVRAKKNPDRDKIVADQMRYFKATCSEKNIQRSFGISEYQDKVIRYLGAMYGVTDTEIYRMAVSDFIENLDLTRFEDELEAFKSK
jgi:hypothetical protein